LFVRSIRAGFPALHFSQGLLPVKSRIEFNGPSV